MPIMADVKPTDFVPAPEGTHQAVCCDVVDLGMQETNYNGNKSIAHKIKVVWQLNERNPKTGRRFRVSSRYTLSLHEKANLHKAIRAWMGSVPPAPFNTENLIGHNCLITLAHKEREDGTGVWVNVISIGQLLKGMTPIQVEDYTREIDRDADEQPGPGSGTRVAVDDQYAPAAVDDDIPF